MIKNYIKIAFRNLWRHKGFSIINIIGLAVGMTAAFLIFMYVKFELSYDNFNERSDQIYRVVSDIKTPTETLNWSSSIAPIGPALQQDYPEIKANTRIFGAGFLVQRGDLKITENNALFAEPSLFKIFTFPVIKGDVDKAFSLPYTVVLTEKAAKKYFGTEDPIGKPLILDGKNPANVVAVVKDVPSNSHFKFDMLVSIATIAKQSKDRLNQWGNFGNFTYIMLPKGYDINKLSSRMVAFVNRHYTAADKKNGMDYTYFLEPLKDVYMVSKRGAPESGNLYNVRIFSIIAVFILLIACINFINLTTARATERAKEVGIRKVIGAMKQQLTIQFLSESVILCLISFLFSALFSFFLLSLFNQLAGKVISDSIFHHGYLFQLFLIACVIGLCAGLYPALVLSNFKPVTILKGRFSKSSKGILLRKGLVVTQFTISIVLIIGTIVVYNQLSFMRNQSLGFQKNQMLTIDFSGDSAIQSRQDIIKNELKKIPNVLGATASGAIPGFGNSVAYSEIQNQAGAMQQMNMNMYDVDYDFISQFEMKLAAGRIFSQAFGTDTTKAIVINEASAKSLGYRNPADAVGRNYSQWGRTGKIIGVLKDFHFQSLQETVKPLNMRINLRGTGAFTLKVAATNVPATISALQAKWKELAPERPFNYVFVDETFNKQYASEVTFGNLFVNFAVLAIFISCLGLLGLASYSTIQRTREIGIRKVLGASVSGIVNMLSKEFLILVLISALIAFPIAWFAMHSWLQDFAYRITISWWIFVFAGVLALVIAFTTVSFQAIKAALTNPVKSLRSE
ncbi:ABC transporter permease [Mucilaginibacter sp. CAU 1740]|uniref:ABC transporter permease n=1 Tax=Mucilaginibacter sp. CAU 1740 TaxID=3140365 RepID=UPI00325A7EA4